MHKNIAKIIQKIVNESPYNNILFTCEVFEKPTNGFWEVNINFIDRDNAHSEALIKSLRYIGLIYGEALGIDDQIKTVKIC